MEFENKAPEKKSLFAKKSLGQNFLTDPFWIQRIVQAFNLKAGECVLEIGPGKGVLTQELIKKSSELFAVEIDGRMVEYLEELFEGEKNLTLLHGDFLKFNLADTFAGRRLRVLGNLPYHVTSAILVRVLDEMRRYHEDPESAAEITDFSIMIQKEVARRLLSLDGSRAYGILSVFIHVFCDAELLLDVPPQAFTPRPKVDSTVICLRALKKPRFEITDWAIFRRVVRASFNQRRKMLRKSLASLGPLPAISELGPEVDDYLKRRPEQMSPGDFANLANIFAAHGSSNA
jgi:16S rRNA (adenine1518-N6/adenine1519-N6)-dimethyltransferase